MKGDPVGAKLDHAFSTVSRQPPGYVAAIWSLRRRLRLPERIDAKDSRPRRLALGRMVARVLHPASQLAPRTARKAPTASDPLHEALDLKRVDAEDR